MRALTNCIIYSRNDTYYDRAVLLNGGRVSEIVELDAVPKGSEILDLKGQKLMPGMVDLQVNGGDGLLFNDSQSIASVQRVAKAHQSLGTTTIFPTIFTSSSSAMKRLLDSVLMLREEEGSGLGGIHFEGPVINVLKPGVHERKYIRPLSQELKEIFFTAANSMPTIVTLAPEMVSDDDILELTSKRVTVFAGHTSATYERMRSAFGAGLKGGTHLFNAMSPLASREPGTVGALLADDRAYASIIADGFHVSWPSIAVAWRAMKPGHLVLVTDAMPCVGSNLGQFRIGELVIHVKNGRCETEGGTLGGSALDLVTAVANMAQLVGVPLHEAMRMASLYPAEAMQLNDVGVIEAGAMADLVVCDSEMRISSVFMRGEPLAGTMLQRGEIPLQQAQ